MLDSKAYRNLMGKFATGVTVVTTAVDGRLHGLTANAVSSLSLDPMLFLVCIDKGANAHSELERAGHFGVSILAADQMDVSNAFARSGEPEADSLRGVAFTKTANGTPLIDGALAQLECRSHSVLPGGDHTIYVGEVVAGEILSEAAPLLYFSGGYREILPKD